MIKFIKDIKNNHPIEFYKKTLSKISNLDAWKYILEDSDREILSKIIILKCFNNISFSEYFLKDESRRTLEDIIKIDSKSLNKEIFEKYKIDRLILKIHNRLRYSNPEKIFTNEEMKELSIEEQTRIILKEFTVLTD